jgi:hypothetical protein
VWFTEIHRIHSNDIANAPQLDFIDFHQIIKGMWNLTSTFQDEMMTRKLFLNNKVEDDKYEIKCLTNLGICNSQEDNYKWTGCYYCVVQELGWKEWLFTDGYEYTLEKIVDLVLRMCKEIWKWNQKGQMQLRTYLSCKQWGNTKFNVSSTKSITSQGWLIFEVFLTNITFGPWPL